MKARVNKRLAFSALRAVVSIGLICFLFWLMRGSLGEVASAIKSSRKAVLLMSFVFIVFGFLLLSMRLKFIMTAQHLKLTFKETASLVFIGHFFSNFLPTTIGGDLVKAYYASKRTGKKLSSIACIAFDRLLGTLTLILMVLLTCFFVGGILNNKLIVMFLILALAISFVICLILFSRRIARKIPFLGALFRLFNLEEKMKGIYEIIYNYKKHPRLILNAVFISFALQIIMFYSVHFIMKGLNFYMPLKIIFLFMPVIATVSMVPSINGLGVRESSFVIFFGPLIGKEGAFAVSILWLGLNFAVSLIGGVLYLFSKQYRIKGGVKLT